MTWPPTGGTDRARRNRRVALIVLCAFAMAALAPALVVLLG